MSTAWRMQVLLSPFDPGGPLSGELLLDSVTDAILALRLREYGHLPATAETVMIGEDLLACTLSGVYDAPDEPRVQHGCTPDAQRVDETVQPTPDHAYIDVVQRLSGRAVLAFVRDYDAEPDLRIQLFWLAPLAPAR